MEHVLFDSRVAIVREDRGVADIDEILHVLVVIWAVAREQVNVRPFPRSQFADRGDALG